MKYKIVKPNNVYEIDYFVVDEKKYPALTRKNADFFEAVVKLDSNYNKDSEYHKYEEGFNFQSTETGKKAKYCGSTRFWFEEMLSRKEPYERCVQYAIISIDRTNSTHLEATENGRGKMMDIITQSFKTVEELVENLEIPFESSNKNHIISKLSIELPAKKKEGTRSSLSFATKFAAYAAIFLKTKQQYSKYDNIVSKYLPIYVEQYLEKENIRTQEYQINQHQRNTMSNDELYEYKLKMYEKYSKDIEEIIAVLEKEGIEINKEEFDHIIWYGLKG